MWIVQKNVWRMNTHVQFICIICWTYTLYLYMLLYRYLYKKFIQNSRNLCMNEIEQVRKNTSLLFFISKKNIQNIRYLKLQFYDNVSIISHLLMYTIIFCWIELGQNVKIRKILFSDLYLSWNWIEICEHILPKEHLLGNVLRLIRIYLFETVGKYHFRVVFIC